MWTPYQRKIYDAARADQLLSLERGVAPTAHGLVQIAVDMANARGVEKIQTLERDTVTLEIVSTLIVEAPAYERLQSQLCGRIQALIDFYGVASQAGVRVGFKKV